jgi:hypothetical protein
VTDDLAGLLEATWQTQAEAGFLLSDPATAPIEIRTVFDQASGVDFRLRWLPHREIRYDVAELERRGIVNPNRDETKLYRDPRDDSGRFCFLCPDNIREANPMETLLPMTLAGRDYVAGANFAWIAKHHYTIMAMDHLDQAFTADVLAAMIELHERTGGTFRVIYNADHAGATIPWHLHLQVTSEEFPVESLAPGAEASYPAALARFDVAAEATAFADDWLDRDPDHHRSNVLVTGPADAPVIHVFRRDRRLTHAAAKGLIGGFEMCGDLVYSEPDKRAIFEEATAATVREVLEEVRPPLA